jgi:HWE histidine kinase/Domain of unknown function (DUF4118)
MGGKTPAVASRLRTSVAASRLARQGGRTWCTHKWPKVDPAAWCREALPIRRSKHINTSVEVVGARTMQLHKGTETLSHFYIDVPALRPGTVGAYAFAFLCAATGTVLGGAIDPYVVGVPFVTFSPAVIIATLISGLGAGLSCIVLSAASASFFLLPPRWSFFVESSADVVELLVFIFEALFYVILITVLRLTLEGYRRLSRNLEQRVEERTVALRESQERLGSVVAELQHRTRNLISIVSVMADRTLRASKTSDDFRASFQDRLGVLGRAQGLLFRTEGGRVTFDELIDTELAAQSVSVGEHGRTWAGYARRTKRHSTALPHSSIPRDGLARTHDQCGQIRCTQAADWAHHRPMATGDFGGEWQALASSRLEGKRRGDAAFRCQASGEWARKRVD